VHTRSFSTLYLYSLYLYTYSFPLYLLFSSIHTYTIVYIYTYTYTYTHIYIYIQASCFTALEAICIHAGGAQEDPDVSVVALFDHEEVSYIVRTVHRGVTDKLWVRTVSAQRDC
jgi:hypothetical protein